MVALYGSGTAPRRKFFKTFPSFNSRRDSFVTSLRALFHSTALTAAGIALLAAPVTAQEAPASTQPATTSGLDLPSAPTMLVQRDPNRRLPTAIVNGEVITGTDVDHRMALVLNAAEQTPSAEEMQRLRMQVLRNLIDESLQIQEARAQEIPIDRAEIEQTYARVATENFGQDIASLDRYLVSIGSSPRSLKRQIEGQLTWRRLMQRNVAPFVSVSADEVNAIIERLNADRGTQEYRVGEIYLPATDTDRAAVQRNGEQIMQQLREGGSFQAYAVQFSRASTASQGGDLGWVRLPVLPPEMATVVAELAPGQVAGPIAIPGGFTIVLLIDQRQVLVADERDATVALKQFTLPFPPDVTQEQAESMLATFQSTLAAMRGCGDADALAASIGAQSGNVEMTVRDLPPEFQQAVLQMQIGESTEPFGSVSEGIRSIMLCGRDDPQSAGTPDFEELMTRLEDERINQRAQRYLRDLRRDAIVEYN